MKHLFGWPLALLMFVTGCDSKPTAQYPPPVLKGTGTMYIFQGLDGWGNDHFHDALTQWLSENPEAKLVSIEGINLSSESKPKNYVVVVQYPPHEVPPNPPPPNPNQNLEK